MCFGLTASCVRRFQVRRKRQARASYCRTRESDRRGTAIANDSVPRRREACACSSRLHNCNVLSHGSRSDNCVRVSCSSNGSLKLSRVARDQLPQDLELPCLRPGADVRHVALVAPVQAVGEDDGVVRDGLPRSDGRARRDCAVLRIIQVSCRSLDVLCLDDDAPGQKLSKKRCTNLANNSTAPDPAAHADDRALPYDGTASFDSGANLDGAIVHYGDRSPA